MSYGIELFDFESFPQVDLPEDCLCGVAVFYNEMLRLPFFLEHHRKIGIQHFFIVDNGSTDGTQEYLATQSDVTYLPTTKPYKLYRSPWIQVVVDQYCKGKWVLSVDADEQFIYPGWPDVSLPFVLEHWKSKGVTAVYAPMIDMYAAETLEQLDYQPGEPFLDTASYFDSDTFSVRYEEKVRNPIFELRGGVRGRIFGQPPKKKGTFLHKWIAQYCMGTKRARHPLSFQHFAQRKLSGYFKKGAPILNKVPLFYWSDTFQQDFKVHFVDLRATLADDWGALLHFKFFQDFIERVPEEVERGQRFANGLEYKNYNKLMDRLIKETLLYPGSRQFQHYSDLEKVGLGYCSPELNSYLGSAQADKQMGRISTRSEPVPS